MSGFLVLALPRSRTKWLASFLSYGRWHCGHDELQHMRTLDDVRTWFTQPYVGTVETAAAPFWRLFPPGLRIAVVRRPVHAVLASVVRALPECDPRSMLSVLEAADRKLDQIETRMDCLSVSYAELATERGCANLFEHCLDEPHDSIWWGSLASRLISGNLRAQERYCHAYLPTLQRLAHAAKQATLADLHKTRGVRHPHDGFVFAEEPDFDQWVADAQPLFRQHLAQSDQDAEGYGLKNAPLGRQLHAAGVLQITTARQNGRMFGYLAAVIGPTLDARDVLTAQLMLPFASRDCPGLGRRIQSAAIDILRTKGVTQILARAGVRGDGPRLETLYRRMGFVRDGTLHRLDLGN